MAAVCTCPPGTGADCACAWYRVHAEQLRADLVPLGHTCMKLRRAGTLYVLEWCHRAEQCTGRWRRDDL
jgi:hypothetical protein